MNEITNELFAIRPDYARKPFRIATPWGEDKRSVVTKQGTASFKVGEDSEQLFESKIVDAGNQCDFVLSHSPASLVVANKVFDQFQNDFLSTYESFPLVFELKGNRRQAYRFLVPKQRFDIVDYREADIAYFDDVVDPRYARRVLKWAVDESRVPGNRIFSDRLGRSIVNRSLKQELENGFSDGIVLIPLSSLHEPVLGT